MKTLEEIKNEVAIEYSYESYDDFKNLTRKIDTDIIFVMDEFFNKVAKRYAKEVAIASLEKASENAKVKYTLDEELNKYYLIDKLSIIKRKQYYDMKTLELKLKKDVLINKHKYRSYVNYNLGFNNAKESFISAVESKDKSIDINKCLIFVKK